MCFSPSPGTYISFYCAQGSAFPLPVEFHRLFPTHFLAHSGATLSIVVKGTLCPICSTCKNFFGTERSSSFSPSMSLPSKRVLGLLDMISFPTPCFLSSTRGVGRKVQECKGSCRKPLFQRQHTPSRLQRLQSACRLRGSHLVGSVSKSHEVQFVHCNKTCRHASEAHPRTCTRR